jgi:O-antigen/teichoic acid export membrane protein
MNHCSTSQTVETANLRDASAEAAALVDVSGNKHLSGFLRSRMDRVPAWLLALIDQALVSGTRFATTIFLGRAAGAEELGHYSIAYMTLLAMGCVQEALVTTPFAIHNHRLGNRSRSAYAGGSLILHAMLAALSGVLILATALTCWSFGKDPWFIHLAPLVAVVLPLSLMWEFARRSMLAQLQVAAVTRTDATAALIQLLGLTALTLSGHLTAAAALVVLAAGTSITAGTWLMRSRQTRVIRWKLTGLYLRRNWQVGKWLACAQLTGIIHMMVPTLLLAVFVNAAATGLYTAYFNFALLANPLILAVINLLLPKSARAFKESGRRGTAGLVSNAALAMAGILACYVGALALWGDYVVSFVYGAEYLGHHSVLIILGLCTIAWSTSMAFAAGLTALRDARSSFIASLLGTAVSTVIITATASSWEVTGAAVGLCIGSYVAAVAHVVLFAACIRRESPSVPRTWPSPAAKIA